MFLDLNMQWSSTEAAEVMISEASSLGYAGGAFTTTIEGITSTTFKNHKSVQQPVRVSLPYNKTTSINLKNQYTHLLMHYPAQQVDGVKKEGNVAENPGASNGTSHFLQFKRLHVKSRSVNDLGAVFSWARNLPVTGPNCYDLISVSVTDEKMFQHILSQAQPIDIIQLDLYSPRLPFPLKRSQLQLAARQHIYFEVCLNEALISPTSLQQLMRNLPYITRFLPQDRLILTSGASNPMLLRAPMDLAAIMSLLGFTDPKAAQAVLSTNCIALLERAAARRANAPAYQSQDMTD